MNRITKIIITAAGLLAVAGMTGCSSALAGTSEPAAPAVPVGDSPAEQAFFDAAAQVVPGATAQDYRGVAITICEKFQTQDIAGVGELWHKDGVDQQKVSVMVQTAVRSGCPTQPAAKYTNEAGWILQSADEKDGFSDGFSDGHAASPKIKRTNPADPTATEDPRPFFTDAAWTPLYSENYAEGFRAALEP